MIRISIILIVIFTTSCHQGFEVLEEVDRIETYDFKRFKNIQIEARKKKGDKNIAHFYEEVIEGKNYRVPNFEYYPLASLDKNQKYILKAYGIELTSHTEVQANFEEESQKIFELYSNINFYKIYGDAQYCKCIRFEFDEDTHLYYFENISEVLSDITKQKLEGAKKIKEHWYLVNKST